MMNQELFAPTLTDVKEDTILKYDPSVLRLLLQDKTTKKNILWATTDYEALGSGYEEWSEILPKLITGENTNCLLNCLKISIRDGKRKTSPLFQESMRWMRIPSRLCESRCQNQRTLWIAAIYICAVVGMGNVISILPVN